MKKNIVIIGTIVVSGCVIGILMYRNKKYQVIIENLDTIDKEFSLKDTTLNFKPYETGNTREQKMIEIYNSNITMANTLSEPMKSDVIRVMKTWFLTLDREAYLTRITNDIERAKQRRIMEVYAPLIIETTRSLSKQLKYYKKGKTKSEPPYSYHIYGLAMDVGWIKIDDDGNTKVFKYEEPYIDTLSKLLLGLLGNKYEWGGNWTTFIDKPHFQIKWEYFNQKERRQQLINMYVKVMSSLGYTCKDGKCLT